MNSHVTEFYSQFSDESPKGNFHKVISLDAELALSWETLSEMVPELPRGWYELAQLSSEDKKDFLLDYWLSKLPYHGLFPQFITNFFQNLDDIAVFIVKRTFDDPYEVHLIYSLKDNAGFFRGYLPASEEEILTLKKSFPTYILPSDFMAFLQIHNGFSKTTDVTGISPSTRLIEQYLEFQEMLQQQNEVSTNRGTSVNPKTLIPFYESFGMPFYQCFWAEWYPENEMGNVYYSGITKTISDVESSDPSCEGMAFPTFLDWLIFYMERIE